MAKLLDEGRYVPCDASAPSFSYGNSVPPFYDPEKFKRLVILNSRHVKVDHFLKLFLEAKSSFTNIFSLCLLQNYAG